MTTGRRTGRSHQIEIWFGMRQDGSVIYLLSGGGGRSDWVRNIRANPEVTVHLGSRDGAEVPPRGRVVTDPEEDAVARRLLASKYQGWREGQTMSAWARTALAVAIEPR